MVPRKAGPGLRGLKRHFRKHTFTSLLHFLHSSLQTTSKILISHSIMSTTQKISQLYFLDLLQFLRHTSTLVVFQPSPSLSRSDGPRQKLSLMLLRCIIACGSGKHHRGPFGGSCYSLTVINSKVFTNPKSISTCHNNCIRTDLKFEWGEGVTVTHVQMGYWVGLDKEHKPLINKLKKTR